MSDEPSLQKVRDADYAEWRAAMLKWQQDCERHVTLRDTFAAAAFPCCHEEMFGEGRLTGYPADWRDQIVRQAYAYADAMLRERGKTSVGVSATGAESGSTPDAQGFGRSSEYPCQPFDSAPTTDQERFVRFQSAVMNWISEATGFFHDDVLRTDDARDVISDACSRCWDAFDRIAYPTKNHDAAPAARVGSDEDRTDKAAASHRQDRPGDTPVAESATPDGYAYAGWPHPKEKTASISDAEIDALEFVVEKGRIANIHDYGILRSLLIRLRQEWEFRDSPEPIAGCDIDRLKPVNEAAFDSPEPIRIDLSQPCMVDPPSGWKWGFPRRYDPAEDGPMKEWLIRNGYPKNLADKGLTCTFTLCGNEEADT